MILVELGPRDHVDLPQISAPIELKHYGVRLSRFSVQFGGQSIPVWAVKRVSRSERAKSRNLRVSLLRLHAEFECLLLILRNIGRNRIGPEPGSVASNSLQHYLLRAIRNVLRAAESPKEGHEQLIEMAKMSHSELVPGERGALIDRLESQVQIRPNVLRRVADYLEETGLTENRPRQQVDLIINNGDLYMAAKYNVSHSQVGALGDHAEAKDFSQAWQALGNDVDIASLADELKKLRVAAESTEGDKEATRVLPELIAAEGAAQQGEGSRTLTHLRKAGRWALDLATKIGATVAAAAIRASLGV